MSDITELLIKDFNAITTENLSDYRRLWAKKLKKLVRNSEILAAYRQLLSEGKTKINPNLEKILRTRTTRTLSGVTPFAVMTKPFACPGQCIFCPLESGMPKSYLSDEPAAQRAKKLNFDPYLQITTRLDQLTSTGHSVDKIELIVIGGTFSAYPDQYKLDFFKSMFDACNGVVSDSLEAAQEFNETATHRIVGISIETRPDWVTEEEIVLLRNLGVTKIQLGVQAFDESILADIGRGHTLDAVAESTRALRNAGIKICYHFMPDLPGTTPEKDIEMAKIMYQDPRFKPDFVKIYPCVVIPGTKLYHRWKKGLFQNYNPQDLLEVLKQIKLLTPPWARIDRLVRDISKQWVVSGITATNTRQLLKQILQKEGKSCQCIRCREVMSQDYTTTPDLTTRVETTLGGEEHFISFEKSNQLYSLLRLRLPHRDEKVIFPELTGSAIIREIHTFGVATPLHHQTKSTTQHQGLGKLLAAEAERVARKAGYSKIAVIAAVGVKQYFVQLGYHHEGTYMTKQL